jgi:cysteate synthase
MVIEMMKNNSQAASSISYSGDIRSALINVLDLPATADHYRLTCPTCGADFADDGVMLGCTGEHAPTLLATEYAGKSFEINAEADGLYRYQSWLPIRDTLPGAGGTITYRSERLCRLTGLPNLWIALNGYWPKMGAMLETATFKELEAYAVLARIDRSSEQVLVVASAGNTAAAFALTCSRNSVPCLIVIPENSLDRLQFSEPLRNCVKIVCLGGQADYYDAILLADRVAKQEGFFPEGGVKNVARRDGIGTTMLNAAETIGQLPDYYFQAIGSGTGAIAVTEAARRLLCDGGYGSRLPRLMLSQNLPFAPIYHSWKSQQRELVKVNREDGKYQIRQIAAPVLSNMNPPYAIRGGVFDVLRETDGDMLVADNEEALSAARLFEEVEGIDIDTAAGVAFATLLKAAREQQIDSRARVLLHITGSGWRARAAQGKPVQARPALTFEAGDIAADETLEQVVALF